jgi:hypothetical protein
MAEKNAGAGGIISTSLPAAVQTGKRKTDVLEVVNADSSGVREMIENSAESSADVGNVASVNVTTVVQAPSRKGKRKAYVLDDEAYDPMESLAN